MSFKTIRASDLSVVLSGLLIFLITSCAPVIVNNSESKPGKSASAPGQVKKTTGSQSAKPYAPGQQKKKNK